jgi:hypothetical protein
MKMHNLWIHEQEVSAIRMDRCGWISMVTRGTICPGVYKSTIMQTIRDHITDAENKQLCTAIEEDSEIEMDEFNDVRENLCTYLDLQWNNIMYRHGTATEKGHALEFLCPKCLVSNFHEILS